MKSKQSLWGVVLALTLVFTVAGAPLRPQPAQASTEDAAIFYDELSQHGSWVDYEQYGPVWYPSQVEEDWRPYSNGRWTPSEQGYLFETQEPWGWATYHYGNWMPTENYGWVWVPGRTWYPNTVAWRNSPESAPVDTSYIGWAPLPPPNYVPPPAYAPPGYAPPPPGYYGGGGYPGGGGALDVLGAPFWIFSQAARFLLGFGQPYTPAYSYYGCGCLAPPTYYPAIYPATTIIRSWYYPSYYRPAFFGGAVGLGAYSWGPPTAYVSRVTNINNITINNYIRNVNIDNVRGGWPDRVVFNRNRDLRKIMPADNPAAFSRVKPMQVRNVDQAVRHLGNPRAIVQPAGLKSLDTTRIPKATVASARQVSPGQPMKVRGMGLPGRSQQQVTPQMAERIKSFKPAGVEGAAGMGRGQGAGRGQLTGPGVQKGIVGGQEGQGRGRKVGPGEGPGTRRGPVTQEGFQQPGGVKRGPGEGPGVKRGPVTQEGFQTPGGVKRGPAEGTGMRRGPVTREGFQQPGGVKRGPGEGPGVKRGPVTQEGFQTPGGVKRGPGEGAGTRRGPVTQEGVQQPGGVKRGPGEGPGAKRGPTEGYQGKQQQQLKQQQQQRQQQLKQQQDQQRQQQMRQQQMRHQQQQQQVRQQQMRQQQQQQVKQQQQQQVKQQQQQQVKQQQVKQQQQLQSKKGRAQQDPQQKDKHPGAN